LNKYYKKIKKDIAKEKYIIYNIHKLKKLTNNTKERKGKKQMQKVKTQKGITLIALIITIIVMLILVGVSVTVALNGGLFNTAQNAKEQTEVERDEELALSDGIIKMEKPSDWNENVSKVLVGTKTTIPLPKGYSILEDDISEGIVITDGTNEFVWIPVASNATFANSYTTKNGDTEPETIAADTNANLTTYYGADVYTMADDFDYSAHYTEIKTSIEKYDGFYVGRYETTIDASGNIGSKANTTVLTANQKVNSKEYRWWGLYAAQRVANVKGNGNYVQTNMITGQQWDLMLSHIKSALNITELPSYDTMFDTISPSGNNNIYQHMADPDGDGIPEPTEVQGDSIYNICELSGNAAEWTTLANTTADDGTNEGGRVQMGGHYHWPNGASNRPGAYSPADGSTDHFGSRLTLYIK